MTTALICLLLLAGGVFGLVGSIGLVRLPTPLMRLHGPTKATTLGIGAILAAALVLRYKDGEGLPVALILIAVFLLATAPVVSMMLARLHIRERGEHLPPPAGGGEWSVTLPEASHPDS